MTTPVNRHLFTRMLEHAVARAHRAAAGVRGQHPDVESEIWISDRGLVAEADLWDLPDISVLVELVGDETGNGEPDHQCEACCYHEVRYVHHLAHPAVPGELAVVCVGISYVLTLMCPSKSIN